MSTKKVADSCGGVRVEGREVQLICANETLLSVSGLLVISEQNGNSSVMHMCGACLPVLCDFKSARRNEAGGLQQLLHPVTTM